MKIELQSFHVTEWIDKLGPDLFCTWLKLLNDSNSNEESEGFHANSLHLEMLLDCGLIEFSKDEYNVLIVHEYPHGKEGQSLEVSFFARQQLKKSAAAAKDGK